MRREQNMIMKSWLCYINTCNGEVNLKTTSLDDKVTIRKGRGQEEKGEDDTSAREREGFRVTR